MAFADVDAVIEDRVGKSVAEIFADDGEAVFRAFEEADDRRAARRPRRARPRRRGGAVAAHPGGARRAARRLAAGHASPHAAGRVGLDEARPLLLGNVRGRLVKLLNERTPLYAEVATGLRRHRRRHARPRSPTAIESLDLARG